MDLSPLDKVEDQPEFTGENSICNPTPDNYQYWSQFWNEIDIDKLWEGLIPRETQPGLLRMFQIKGGDAMLVALEVRLDMEIPPELFNPTACQAECLTDKVPKVYWMVMVKNTEDPEDTKMVPCADGYTCSTNCIPYSWATMNRNYYYRVLLKEIMYGGLMTISVPMQIYQIPAEVGVQPGQPDTSFLVEIPEFRIANQSPKLIEALQDTVEQFSMFMEELMVDNGITVALQLGPTAFDPQDIIDLGFVTAEEIETLKRVKEKQAIEPIQPIGQAFTRGDITFEGQGMG